MRLAAPSTVVDMRDEARHIIIGVLTAVLDCPCTASGPHIASQKIASCLSPGNFPLVAQGLDCGVGKKVM